MSAKIPKGKLQVAGPPGVRFTVSDGYGFERERGSGSAEFTLPQGLYKVGWQSGHDQCEALVSVAEGDAAVATYVAEILGADAPLRTAAADIVKELEGAKRPSQADHGSAIAVVVTAERGARDALQGMRLCNSSDVAMRADPEQQPILQLGSNQVARYYAVPPADYLLSFPSITGETLQQTLPAFRDRTTLVFLEQVSANVLVADGETFTVDEQESRGIDVARTVMITVAGDEEEVRIRERARLAAALLRDIASGTSSLDEEFLKILDDKRTDPLLRLLAAVVIVLRLEADLLPLAGGSRVDRRRLPPQVKQEWAERARGWLSIDKGLMIAPDQTVLQWRLAKLLGSARRVRARSSIPHPPMLAASWRWALDHSAREPAALPPTTPNVAAARSGVLREPWLCWKESASKAAPAIVPLQEGRTIVELAASIAAKAKELIEHDTSDGKLDALFEELTPTASKIAHQAMRSAPNKLDSPSLAVALGLPGGALPSMLTMTEREIVKALEQFGGADPAPASPPGRAEIAPPTSRKIVEPDDPQKGRFGGAARRDGFTLSARFSPTKSRNWVRIELRVDGPASEGEEVQFHLHDSFRPAMQKCAFRRGCAKLAIKAWGGFTVGVWIASRGIELELDLAKVPGAPYIIKTR